MARYDREELIADLQAARDEDDVRGPELAEDEIASLAEVAELLWDAAHGAPPLESDPVAAMLGLVADPALRLDSRALARARKSAGLTARQLADRLRARGWDVQARDVFRWENQSADDVVPAIVEAIAEETSSPFERLTRATATTRAEQDWLATVTNSRAFQGLAERWVRLRGVPRAFAVSALRSRMTATVHRGERPNAEQLLQSLDALVTALEDRENTR